MEYDTEAKQKKNVLRRDALLRKQQGTEWACPSWPRCRGLEEGYFLHRHRYLRFLQQTYGRPQMKMKEWLARIEDQLRGLPHAHEMTDVEFPLVDKKGKVHYVRMNVGLLHRLLEERLRRELQLHVHI